MYVPGPDFTFAAERIADCYNRAVNQSSDQPVLLLGDFNKCDVTTLLPNLEQYVTTPTRHDRTLDLCFGNIPGAYVAKPRPPLGRSDHNVILLLPKYRQKLKTEDTQTKTVQVWNNDSVDALRGCMEITDWEIFFQSCEGDLNLLTDCITSYLSFCVDTVIPTKQVKLYPNNKPWVTKDLKQCLNNKKVAFLQGDKNRVKECNSELRRKTRLAKLHYKNKVEEKFTTGNAREAWQGLNTMMGRAQKPAIIQCSDPATFAEQLNTYYSRFNMPHPQNDWTLTSNSSLTVDKGKVTSRLGRINPH